ncbi:Gfo/Idh/MocA family oxidoreductase [Pullulanibacillus sp. KACC 23026]|uniref:Gfo/Idh/MocA family protein n=1 Tax=Pullulanibacillus sp. KACC 23026 TaxID=3028315 RepID=UPI0023AEAD6D|nr:Gfo/Idh/MocA family oxidoreductase [Pullulanibacillus sp. KACC 23026]WEG10771.1 Gfo/Idh/MocA family oxidoreductase [Pullulanibacillus sp. KACC 23026]
MKIVVIGSGTMAHTHTDAYTNMTNVELVGVVDIREDLGRPFAQKYNILYFSSLDEALEQTEVDVVDVCVPTYLHKNYVIQAANAKKHVICEKPLARSIEDACEMIEHCKSQSVRLFVGHVVRFFPEFENARQLILDGEIGKVGTVRFFRGGPFPKATFENWYADTARSGGVILDLMIHDFDFLQWTFGKAERVYTKALPDMDYALTSIRFKNGVIANVEGSWSDVDDFHTEYDIAGSEGLLQHDSRKEKPLQISLKQENSWNAEGVAVPESPMFKRPYQLELENFIHCIETGETARVTPNDALEALRLSFASIESAKTGKAVTL